jgi:hypothetical protein
MAKHVILAVVDMRFSILAPCLVWTRTYSDRTVGGLPFDEALCGLIETTAP